MVLAAGTGHGNAGPPPAGTIDFCHYGGSQVVDVPASGTCPGIGAVRVVVDVYDSLNLGYVLTVNFPELTGSTTVFGCPGACSGLPPAGTGLWCVWKGAGTYEGPCADSPYTSNSPSSVTVCNTRPYSHVWTWNTYPYVGGCATDCKSAWYVLGGGTCPSPAPATTQPAVVFTFTLSEP
jgi:hypothetical protein